MPKTTRRKHVNVTDEAIVTGAITVAGFLERAAVASERVASALERLADSNDRMEHAAGISPIAPPPKGRGLTDAEFDEALRAVYPGVDFATAGQSEPGAALNGALESAGRRTKKTAR